MISFWRYDSPLGIYTVAEDGEGICALFFEERPGKEKWNNAETPLLKRAAARWRNIFPAHAEL